MNTNKRPRIIMATPPGLLVQLAASSPQYVNVPVQNLTGGAAVFGYQCDPSQNVCLAVNNFTADLNYPVYNSIQECQQVCAYGLPMKQDFK